LVEKKRALAGNVEGFYSREEQETFKNKAKQSVKTGGLSNGDSNVIERGVHLEHEWEKEKGPVVGEVGSRMVAEKLSIIQDAHLNDRWAIWKESNNLGGF